MSILCKARKALERAESWRNNDYGDFPQVIIAHELQVSIAQAQIAQAEALEGIYDLLVNTNDSLDRIAEQERKQE
ncbi:hypothetical protein LCGC14_0386990 [marine sediment metagenome]|uniref:HEPN domain-containing protein n=1 Tax=marine sediment metagenome TaxID=412755 RepID=A0A0F9VMX7_9ZZZZ